MLISSIIERALMAGTPLFLGTLGEVYAERSGVMNLGVEGMMAAGAMSGFGVALSSGSPWLGLAAAAGAGLALSLLHAAATVTLRANQVVSGLALTMLGLGLSGLLGKPYIGIPLKVKFEPVPIPFLSQIPWIGPLFARDPVFYLAVVLGAGLWVVLFHTRWGLVVRSVGENPLAAATAGVQVGRVRYLCISLGGILAGAAGGYLSLAYLPSWIEGMTAGRGWIVIALTVFSLWNPARALLGAYLFGGVYVLQYFLHSEQIPPNVLNMLPYIATLVVLMLFASGGGKRLVRGPASLGLPYHGEDR